MTKSDKTSVPMPTTPSCIIDRAILNEDTVGQMDDLGLAVFAKLCGFNRGVFVLDPPDGMTYGCISFPPIFSEKAGISNVNLTIQDSASLTIGFTARNYTASQTVSVVDQYVGAVYDSSSGVDLNPYGCDMNGLATLDNCDKSSSPKSLRDDGDIVKSVTLAGAFVPAPWATKGHILSVKEVNHNFYTIKDFEEMSDLGVNTVQIPVPCDAFVNGDAAIAMGVSSMLKNVEKAGLSAILVLVEMPHEGKEMDDETIETHIESAALFASKSPTVIALQLPSSKPSHLSAARSISETLPILAPMNKEQFTSVSLPPDPYLFVALDVVSTTSVAGIASSDSETDRMKMFYHESLACVDRSPIEWMDCFHSMPVYITSGFDLSVDDCFNREYDKEWKDYGQCDRFDETVGSGWWERHRESLAERMLSTYSKGAGWSFSAWKLYADDNDGEIDAPAKLLCLRDVAASGLIASLKTVGSPNNNSLACLNGPVADFHMGDATFSPTSSPPPDCGYGWWNATTLKCDYWIPPAPTPNPTYMPTFACPSCEERGVTELGYAAVGGAVVALVLNWAVKKVMGRGDGYERLP